MARQRPWIIEDCAIASHDQDRFDHQSVSRELLAIVRASTQPLAIGLLGPFGSGKSSVVRLLAAELQGDKKWAVLHLSAERHSGSARARGLLYGLLDEAHRQSLITQAKFESERACLNGGRQRTAPRPTPMSDSPGAAHWSSYPKAAGAALGWILASLVTMWLLGVAVVLIGHAGGIAADVPAWTWFTAPDAQPLTTALSGAAVVACVLGMAKEGALSALKRHEITLTTPRPESTDDLEQVFSSLIGGIDRKLIIAIDDLDRLAASEVLEALTTIRSLLLTGTHHARPPVFLLSCDEDIIREAIVGVRPGLAHRPAHRARPSGGNPRPRQAAERKATEEAAQEYLNKLFTVRLTLPAHHEADLRQYIEHLLTRPQPHELITRLGISAMRDLLETLIHPGVRDPRHAIRLLNSFLADYGLATRREQPNGTPAWIAPGEVTSHPIVLARLTVLRHDYRALYDEIRAEHDLLALLDDALLGSATALRDPLLAPYSTPNTADEATADPEDDGDVLPRLDTTAHPGLHYLRATAAKARTRRPAHLMPLLTLGSTPASRALGSEAAAAVQRELLQRDADAFYDRLQVTDMRERVLPAATHALESARSGQDLDNTLAAIVHVLARIPDLADHLDHGADPVGRALLALTERVASRRSEAVTPVPAHHLIGILGLVPSAHLPSLYTTLSHCPSKDPGDVPANEQSAFAWAQALILLPPGEHASHLRPALESYFRTLARTGGTDDLRAWLAKCAETSAAQRARWPRQAYHALMGMAARAMDDAMTAEVRHAVDDASEHHQWQRPVMRGVLEWLSAEDDGLRTRAIEFLRERDVPDDGWGSATDPNAASGSTLATELVEHAITFLLDDDDAERAERTAELLHQWLRFLDGRKAPSGNKVSTVVADSLAQTAHTCLELATAAARILPDLPQQDAATCAVAIAENLGAPTTPDDRVGNVLAEALLIFMRIATNDVGAREAARTCLKALTTSLATDDARGAFARRHLPAVMSTDAGREAGPTLIDEFTPRLSQSHITLPPDVFSSLHILLLDPATRAARLSQVLQHLYGRMSVQPGPNVTFVAHYAADAAVNAQWLTWIAQHWAAIPVHERTLATAAAHRTDLSQIGGLSDLMARHLLDTEDVEPWRHATSLWDKIGPDQQAALLVAAHGRCPELGNQASVDVLVSAMSKANADALSSLLVLISSSPHASQAICDYLDDTIAGREWSEAEVAQIAAACPDPALLWKVLLAALPADQTSVQRVSLLIATLLVNTPDATPDDFVGELAPVLREATAASAAALGHAVRSAPQLATALRRTLHGHSKTAAEKERTTAFKRAAGIR